MEVIKKIMAWIVWSSKDPEKLSLTVKGVLGTGVVLAGYLGVSSAELGPLVEGMTKFTSEIVGTVTAAMAVWGAVRKLYTTYVGTNQVINQ